MIKDEDTAYEQARQERIDQPLLSDRLRPGVECAPWVIEEVRKLEKQLEIARTALQKLSCLGNGDQPGNSIGNCIAQDALLEIWANQ